MKRKNIIMLFIIFTAASCSDKLDFPGGIITEESVKDRFEQSKKWNDDNGYKKIDVLTDNYKLLIFADSHIGETKNFDEILDSAIISNSSGIAILGDLCSGHTKDYDTLQYHLNNHNSKPIFLMVGNHDLFFDGWSEYYNRFGSSTYYFTVKTPKESDLYICLDSGSGTLGDKQLAWLKDVLKTVRPKFRNCIVLTHNNLFRISELYKTKSPIAPLPIEEVEVLMEYFAEYNVNMVIVAHVHLPTVKLIGNTTYITVSACIDGFYNPNYLILEIINKKINYKFKYLNNQK